MDDKKLKITFEIDLSFSDEIETQKEKKVEIDAIKDYITCHLQELEGHRNFGTRINSVTLSKKIKKKV